MHCGHPKSQTVSEIFNSLSQAEIQVQKDARKSDSDNSEQKRTPIIKNGASLETTSKIKHCGHAQSQDIPSENLI